MRLALVYGMLFFMCVRARARLYEYITYVTVHSHRAVYTCFMTAIVK